MLFNTFHCLWGRLKSEQVEGSIVNGRAVLLEENFTRNIKYVIGTDCPYFGKLLFLYLGGGFDRARINLQDWFKFFGSFADDDDRLTQQQLCFDVLDIDRDGLLNILNLLHLYKNLPPTSALGMEIVKLTKYLIKNNIEKSSYRRPVLIDFDIFNECLKAPSCLREEFRNKFLGLGIDLENCD